MGAKVHLVYCTDAGYLMPTLVSAASAAVRAKRAALVVHVIETGVSDEAWREFADKLKSLNSAVEVVRHAWTDTRFDGCPAWHGSRIIYARLVVQDLIPEADWAISVDGDTLWLGDPAEMLAIKDPTKLYQVSVDPPDPNGRENPVFAWYRERDLKMDSAQYYCVGAQLMNLKKLREEKFTEQALAFLKRYPDPKFPEQMVMCYLAQGKMAPLPKEWGCYSFYHHEIDIAKPCLIHFVQDAPWKRKKVVNLVSDISLVWHRFARERKLATVPWFGCSGPFDYAWRRGLFLFFKYNQWQVKCLPCRLRMLLSNTRGIRSTYYALPTIH